MLRALLVSAFAGAQYKMWLQESQQMLKVRELIQF